MPIIKITEPTPPKRKDKPKRNDEKRVITVEVTLTPAEQGEWKVDCTSGKITCTPTDHVGEGDGTYTVKDGGVKWTPLPGRTRKWKQLNSKRQIELELPYELKLP